jgi:hypothetical protein
VLQAITYTASLYAKLALAGSKSMTVTINWYDGADAIISSSTSMSR